MRDVYLDHAATTYLDPRVYDAMKPYFMDTFANPSSFHTPGLHAKQAVSAARQSIAKHLNVREDEILFTSGGTESDNLAMVGITRAHASKGKHVITSAIEHPAVLEPLLHLQKKGEIELTVLPVDREGMVNVDDLTKALRVDTILVSIMYANNEIGTIQPIADIGRAILKWRKENLTPYPYFHTDACQAAGALDLDAEKLHVDALTLNASKIYGPKGIGILYARRALKIEPMIRGGGQEKKSPFRHGERPRDYRSRHGARSCARKSERRERAIDETPRSPRGRSSRDSENATQWSCERATPE